MYGCEVCMIVSNLFAGSKLFLASGKFPVPAGVTIVRALAVGGGSGGDCGGHGGGGSGLVKGVTVSVNPGQTYDVTVGAGADGRYCGEQVFPGGTSSFNGIQAPGGAVAINSGGYGGSGGGAGCIHTEDTTPGAGGSDGSSGGNCATRSGAGGQGSFAPLFAIFKLNKFSAGAGGAPGVGAWYSGGGAGGVKIEGQANIIAGNGLGSGAAQGGHGFGAGGGAGGGVSDFGDKGGSGKSGFVYIEWD